MDNATVNGNDMEEVANSFIMEPKEEEETSQVDASENEDEYEAEEETIEASVDDTEEGDYAEDSEDDETTADDDACRPISFPLRLTGRPRCGSSTI